MTEAWKTSPKATKKPLLPPTKTEGKPSNATSGVGMVKSVPYTFGMANDTNDRDWPMRLDREGHGNHSYTQATPNVSRGTPSAEKINNSKGDLLESLNCQLKQKFQNRATDTNWTAAPQGRKPPLPPPKPKPTTPAIPIPPPKPKHFLSAEGNRQ